MAYAGIVAPMLLRRGVGFALSVTIAPEVVVGAVGPRCRSARPPGTLSTIRQLGGAFGVAIVVAVFTGAGSYASPAAFSDGVAAAMGVCAALSFTGAIAGGLARGRSRPQPAREVAAHAVG